MLFGFVYNIVKSVNQAVGVDVNLNTNNSIDIYMWLSMCVCVVSAAAAKKRMWNADKHLRSLYVF